MQDARTTCGSGRQNRVKDDDGGAMLVAGSLLAMLSEQPIVEMFEWQRTELESYRWKWLVLEAGEMRQKAPRSSFQDYSACRSSIQKYMENFV